MLTSIFNKMQTELNPNLFTFIEHPPLEESAIDISIAPPILVEKDHTSLTISWVPNPDAEQYELCISPDLGISWRSLSDSLRQTRIRKKNLENTCSYSFKIRHLSKSTGEWSQFSRNSEALNVVSATTPMMEPPSLQTKDGVSVTIQWSPIADCEGYNIRFRSDTTECTSARKKGLQVGENYYFSVIPVGSAQEFEYSSSSSPMSIPVLSSFLRNLFPTTLLSKVASSPQLSTSEVLAGKVVAVYFSAHWCGPCRNFTPSLATLYQQAKAANKEFEVIFCSCDHSETEFRSYYGTSMPWLAIPYDDDKREELSGTFKVTGIPRLCILAPSGRILVDNAAGQPLSMATLDAWIQSGKTS